jgi:acyl-coenzyme A thioesterase PaaI-like protein
MFYTEPADPAQLVLEVQSLAALGPMVNGWDGICHGGIVVTLLDEAMGQLFAVNKMRGVMREMPVLTGWLNTRFMKPVRTGNGNKGAGDGRGKGVVLVTARLVKWEGRKFWAEATVEGEDGAVLARADALFVQLRGRL